MSQNNNAYIFIGSYPGKDNYDVLVKKYFKKNISFSNAEYERVLFEEFKKQTSNVYFLSAPVVGKYPTNTKKSFVKLPNANGVINCHYSAFKPFIYQSKSHSLIKNLKNIIKKNNLTEFENVFVIASELHLPYLKSLKYSKKYNNVKTCSIVPDIPSVLYKKSNNFFVSTFRKFYGKLCLLYSDKYSDSFLFFTDSMKSLFNLSHKPFIVKEGIIEKIREAFNHKSDKSCLFLGKTDIQNGIGIVLESAKKRPDITFNIYGSGSMDEELKICKLQNVHFYGFINPNFTERLFEDNRIFLSPRFPDDYTKYSFPSKIIKYVSYCKPIVTMKLPCYSDKFDDILSYMSDSTSDALVNSIDTALAMDSTVLKFRIETNLHSLLKENYVASFLRMLSAIN